MKGFLFASTAMVVVAVSRLIAAEPSPAITVLAYNYAAVPAPMLDGTKRHAAGILRHSGVQIEWLDCPLSPQDTSLFPACTVPPGPTRLAIRILPQHMAEAFKRPPHSFGFALFSHDGGFANVANVFAHRAEQISTRHRMRKAGILGCLVAHELGHLLLGEGSHSRRGIMRVPWRRQEIQQIAQGTMRFTRAQSQKMRINARARARVAEPDRN